MLLCLPMHASQFGRLLVLERYDLPSNFIIDTQRSRDAGCPDEEDSENIFWYNKNGNPRRQPGAAKRPLRLSSPSAQ